MHSNRISNACIPRRAQHLLLTFDAADAVTEQQQQRALQQCYDQMLQEDEAAALNYVLQQQLCDHEDADSALDVVNDGIQEVS
jgi:hypothetical protein